MTTVAELTGAVEERCAAFLAEARRLTGDPDKPNVDQAIGWAVRALGHPTTSVLTVTDEEVGAVAGVKLDALLDLAELRTLESIQTNLTAVTVQAGQVRQEYNDLAGRLAHIIPEKRRNAAARHGKWLVEPLSGDAPKRASVRAV